MMLDIHVKLNPGSPGTSSIQQGEGSFHQQIALKFKEETGIVLHLEYMLCMVLRVGHFRK